MSSIAMDCIYLYLLSTKWYAVSKQINLSFQISSVTAHCVLNVADISDHLDTTPSAVNLYKWTCKHIQIQCMYINMHSNVYDVTVTKYDHLSQCLFHRKPSMLYTQAFITFFLLLITKGNPMQKRDPVATALRCEPSLACADCKYHYDHTWTCWHFLKWPGYR